MFQHYALSSYALTCALLIVFIGAYRSQMGISVSDRRVPREAEEW